MTLQLKCVIIDTAYHKQLKFTAAGQQPLTHPLRHSPSRRPLWSFDNGDLTSTPTTFDLQLRGLFTAAYPIGKQGKVISHMVQDYAEEQPYECTVAMIDKGAGGWSVGVSLKDYCEYVDWKMSHWT